MRIEIITTGDEVMQGVIVDTNTSWIAKRCHSLGHEIVRHSSVCDDIFAVGDLLIEASRRADAVIVTGGLGPTADDITIEAAAQAFGVKLKMNEEVLKGIYDFFQRIDRPASLSNDKQALIPEGGQVLQNLVGTAPGISVKLGHAQFFFLPGVPRELYQIFTDSVVPWLACNAAVVMSERVLRCFGMPEATLDERLRGLDLGDTRLSFRVKFPEILLKVVARAKEFVDAECAVAAAADGIRKRLGPIVYGEGETSLAAVVGNMLVEQSMTLAIAESCTGGLLASMITDIPGASTWFERSVVCYSNRSKVEMLGVSKELLEKHGAVSAEAAMAMAEGVRRISNATLGLAVTGIAGPGGGTPEKPVGTVHIALATPSGTNHQRHIFNRDRLWFKQIVSWTALDMVRRYMIGE